MNRYELSHVIYNMISGFGGAALSAYIEITQEIYIRNNQEMNLILQSGGSFLQPVVCTGLVNLANELHREAYGRYFVNPRYVPIIVTPALVLLELASPIIHALTGFNIVYSKEDMIALLMGGLTAYLAVSLCVGQKKVTKYRIKK
ncbi:hypothetical protein JW930_07025 [Candidatus Woesearchaeota archaeon]|nr:hypothetical protein [Candidatus Woesearchaeota archaeon]